MLYSSHRSVVLRLVAACLILSLAFVATACNESDSDTTDTQATESPAVQDEQVPEEPEYTSWKVYINDDDSYEEGGITYEIALNLEATNPSGEISGTYTGKAVASTSTTGDVGGQQLNASAIAHSSNLQFSLEDVTQGTDLAPLTEDAVYSGTGSITMEAAGSGTVGPAGGSFSNNSSQPLTVSVSGTDVTLEIPIDGHTYVFKGTISGQ